ncbi:uroporphyrinogen decarboxylase, partial [Haematococcus lacustris]
MTAMQPWKAYKTDGVIFFSDILTPLPALGIEFDVVKGKGPLIATPIRSMEQVKALQPMADPDSRLPFIRTILSSLRQELAGSEAALLGFVGTPWTLAAYAMEGKADKDCKETKAIVDATNKLLLAAGPRGHILNVGHGVVQGTPEAA